MKKNKLLDTFMFYFFMLLVLIPALNNKVIRDALLSWKNIAATTVGALVATTIVGVFNYYWTKKKG